MKAGIVGLPNVGKSTLFNCLTNGKAQSANFPFCTIDPNFGAVTIPDDRLNKLVELVKPEKTIPNSVEIVDIAGLVKGASKGEGLGNQFLSNIRETNAIIHVLRCYENDNITHVEGSVDPYRDKEIIDFELQIKDLETIKKRTDRIERQAKSGDKSFLKEFNVLDSVVESLNKGISVRLQSISVEDYNNYIKPLSLLTSKPVLYVCNINENEISNQSTELTKLIKFLEKEGSTYFINSQISLNENETKEWYIVSDVNKSSSEVLELKKIISEEKNIIAKINQCIEKASDDLLKLVGASDGLQTSQRRLRNIRHFSNTLFNIMRGGIFDNHYDIEKLDFSDYIKRSNKKVFSKKKDLINNLPEIFDIKKLRFLCENDDDKNFIRLCYEYLPLKFSRRHGDPSRPWNKFSINTRNEIDDSKILDYQGNWRDIFQNWEALAYSYPEFIEGMICKFLNSTTFDGYNPYRVTKYGFDWETIEADNPWSYIGYWGDHQIIYLLKFLEFIENYYPGKIKKYLDHDFFVYANVPYKIKSHDEILKDPKNTIDFDFENEEKILRRRERFGIDGALLRDENYFIIKVNFIEKILATSLAKISNFIPEAGIWMNTQRPEWNDANNALVGNGVSMVTLYYLRRFLGYFKDIIEKYSLSEYDLSSELKDYFDQIYSSLINNENLLVGNINDHDRKLIMDQLGVAASSYRNTIYKNGFSGDKSLISKKEILEFINITIKFLNHSIKSNKRSDGLYHAYNLITIHDSAVEISYLPEMLEGQVAILSSGALSTNENLEVLNNLRNSKLFRPDQYSYLLYPNKNLPGFLEKNNIPDKDVLGSKFLTSLVEEGNKQIIVKDCHGGYHFNGLFNNINSLVDEIKKLPEKYTDLVKKERDYVYDLFEKVFDHKSFTGRSGTFYGYEGLGSIYWHMVSKLQLAVYEVTSKAIKSKDDKKTIGKLFDHYFEINEGVGVNKSPDLYGAFPTDPYSHTPFGRGAQQPGMTGQVKEDIISRFGELGLRVFDGKISFDPSILRKDEFNLTESVFKYVDYNSKIKLMNLNKNTLAFSICQVPVIYHLSKSEEIEITFVNGDSKRISGNEIDEINSKKIFERNNEIEKIDVFVVKNI